MTKLYLLRHGEAAAGQPDSERALTPNGHSQVAAKARHLPQGLACWVSPFLRAEQSLAALQAAGFLPNSLNSTAALTPDASVADLIGLLLDFEGQELLLVGHNPLLTDLVRTLADCGDLVLDTASLAVLEGDLLAPHCMDLLVCHR